MGELLLELLSEEIPARMQRRAIEDLTGLIRDRLARADIAATALEGHVTPRRLTVIADGIPARQPDRSEERRGPRVGAPQQAIDGFLRGAGIGSIDQCEQRGTDRGEFYFAVIKQPGRSTAEVLPELILAAMTSLPWPKSMRYPASNLRWVRPLNSAICLFDGDVISLPLGEVPVGRVTRGHRFLSPGVITVADAADYREKLAKAHVVLDHAARRDIIAKGLDKLAKAEGLTVKPDEALLDEVTGLVEWPVVLMGSIDADFVRPLPDGLPPEVLATAMRTHQKYFSCLNKDGSPAPRFLFVANNLTPDGGKTIAAGNERVLRARLSDARFFWDQDRKVRLEDRVEALKQRVYHEKLGSVYDKVERMEKLAEYLASQLSSHYFNRASITGSISDATLTVTAVKAAHLSKADLSSGTVGEFPELQGIMGRYYALGDDVELPVAEAIAEHYRPLGPSDICPTRSTSVLVGLADKFDTLVTFFAVGEKPTGSRDPFALRRAGLGSIRLIIENSLRLHLKSAFARAYEICLQSGAFRGSNFGPFGSIDPTEELLEFIADRLKVHLREAGVRHDLIAAAFANPHAFGSQLPSEITAAVAENSVVANNDREDDLVRLLMKVKALQTFLDTDDGTNLLTAYRRASHIVAIEERKDGPHTGPVDAKIMRQPEEIALYQQLIELGPVLRTLMSAEAFDRGMEQLSSLRKPIDEFFEHVTVNAPEKELRENRLRLLARIRTTMKQVADFSQIEG